MNTTIELQWLNKTIHVPTHEWRRTKVKEYCSPYYGSYKQMTYEFLPLKFEPLKRKRRYPPCHYSAAIRWLLGEDWKG